MGVQVPPSTFIFSELNIKMNITGIVVILILILLFFGTSAYFAMRVFDKLRAQNVGVVESIFLSFIYPTLYLWSRGNSREDLEVSREKIWKRAIPFFILIFGISVIAFACIIKLKNL